MKNISQIINYGKFSDSNNLVNEDHRPSESSLNQFEGGHHWYDELKDQSKNSMKNPMTGTAGFNNLDRYEYADYINGGKTMWIWIGSQDGLKRDWRSKSVNNMFEVNKNIILIPEQNNISIKSGMKLKEAGEAKTGGLDDLFSKVTGFLGKAADAVTALNNLGSAIGNVFAEQDQTNQRAAAKVIGQWDKPKVFEDLKTVTVMDSVKFTFTFGQAGIYSGLEEVVKPIYALVNMLTPHDESDAGASMIEVPYVTGELMSLILAKQGITNVKDIIMGSVNEAGETVGGIANAVNSISSFTDDSKPIGNISEVMSSVSLKLKGIQGDAAKQAALSNKYKNLWIQYGNFRFGPLQYENYELTFDMNRLDEFGWPTSGSITISGITTIRKGISGTFNDMIRNRSITPASSMDFGL